MQIESMNGRMDKAEERRQENLISSQKRTKEKAGKKVKKAYVLYGTIK